MNLKSKQTIYLLWIASLTSILFLFMVECYNQLTLDDLGFAMELKGKSILNFMMGMYLNIQGRFMIFLFNGIQMKSNFLFGSMFPFSLFIYILNILLISISLVNFFKIKTSESILFSIILLQLYIYSMFDISSFFWMCTKQYTLLICLGLFVLSDLICNKKESFLNYAILFISFAFLGCSYEIYAPIILLFLGLVLIFKIHLLHYNLNQFIAYNRKLMFAFFTGTLFFILMMIAPGNLVRLNQHSSFNNLSLLQIFNTSVINCIQLVKFLFLKLHYFIMFCILLYVLITQFKATINPSKIGDKIIVKRICFYLSAAVGMSFVSVFLNTIAIGKRMEIRAFDHINLLVFLFIAFSLFEISKKYFFKSILNDLFPISLMIITVLNLYNTFSNYPELKKYTKSCDKRLEYLEILKREGNKNTIQLKELDAAYYHSVDEIWKILIPKLSKSFLLKPNEVSRDLSNQYNISYKKYYNLNFEVYTTLDYGLGNTK